MMAVARVVINPAGVKASSAQVTRMLHLVVEEMADDARDRCPMDTGELVNSIETRYPGRFRGQVWVGTDHWAPTEYGSAPHLIRSTGPWPLRNKETGQVFGRVVKHPGTPEQPFMRPAAFQKRSVKL